MAWSDFLSSGILPGENHGTVFPGGLGDIGSVISSNPVSRIGTQVQSVLNDPDGVLRRLGPQLGVGGGPLNIPRTWNPSQGTVRDQNGVPIENDWRVRLGFPPALAGDLYTQALLAPLIATDGVVFPYTPNISINYTADWQGQRLTQSNYTPLYYASSDVQDMTITGQFTAMNAAEARYLLAVITFCRLATKMFFGQGPNAGNPPPILHLNGYGKHHFNDVPVVLKTANYQLPPDVDYIEAGTQESIDPTGTGNADLGGGFGRQFYGGSGSGDATRVPTDMAIAFTVQPIYSRRQVSTFDYNKFANGDLIKRGFI